MISLTQRYKHKIVTTDELLEKVGAYPRTDKLIMCHGVFDIIHPGHVRHLLYAKSKAAILVCSITADQHITKGTYRPHVPQDLRAANLAAFEMVDYVIVDANAKPLKNIEFIKPDFFAKGFEYSAENLTSKTHEEIETVENYGGKMLFTPGDIVYSSSNLINLKEPSLKYEKLQIVMEREKITFDDLRYTLTQMTGKKVHVVGDTIVDSYTRCAMIGGQTKTPTMSVLFEEKEDFVGGAAIVAKHMKASGADVTFTTVLGEDSLKDFVLDDLKANNINVNTLIDETRPTTNKNAIVAGGYRLLKVDTLDNRSISTDLLEEMTNYVSKTEVDAVAYCDFRHGIFNKQTIPEFTAALPDHVFKVADSQVASRWGNITDFKGYDLITPNEREARFSLGDQDSGIKPLGCELYNQAECKLLMLKLGEKGMFVCCDSDHYSLDSFYIIDTLADDIVDAVGAGDALLAYATLAKISSDSDAQAGILGTIAAACECEVDGNHPITPDIIRKKIDMIERQMNYV